MTIAHYAVRIAAAEESASSARRTLNTIATLSQEAAEEYRLIRRRYTISVLPAFTSILLELDIDSDGGNNWRGDRDVAGPGQSERELYPKGCDQSRGLCKAPWYVLPSPCQYS